jgi:hypothetical protein
MVGKAPNANALGPVPQAGCIVLSPGPPRPPSYHNPQGGSPSLFEKGVQHEALT